MQSLWLLPLATSIAQQAVAVAYHTVQAIREPNNADSVAAVSELTAFNAIDRIQRVMLADRVGRAILQNKPLVTDDVLHYARTLPLGTFGHHYAQYMSHNRFSPNARAPVAYIADADLQYIMIRYRQCHDFLHTCVECGRTVEEEVALKLLEWTHTGLPLGVLSVIGGAPHMSRTQLSRLPLYYRWATHNAPTSIHDTSRCVRMYLTVPWEALLSKPLDEVRAYTGLTPLPQYVAEQMASERANE